MKLRHFNHFQIAGFSFYDGPFAFPELKIGSALTIIHESDNKFDPKAVAIYFGDYKLGFIPRANNSEISKLLEMGYNIFETRIQKLDPAAHPENQVGVIVYLRSSNTDLESTTPLTATHIE